MANKHIPLPNYSKLTEDEMHARAKSFYTMMKSRRSVRIFSDMAIPQRVIDDCIKVAGTAPSGANQQPWHFVTIKDPMIKSKIRVAAEHEEQLFYDGRAGDTWLDTLAPLGTNAEKPFLEIAPVLIAIFEQKHSLDQTGQKVKHYYSKESTGIATGMLITALHNAGLVSLTHTPSPMNFLSDILNRPEGERAFLLLVVGFPADGTTVPDISKKALGNIQTIV